MMLARTGAEAEPEAPFLKLTVAGQLCGIAVEAIRDILSDQPITRIPLAPEEVAGGLNLRGRIVTAVDLRRRLKLPARSPGDPRMSVVTEQGTELYALLVDEVAEVVPLRRSAMEANPPTLEPGWAMFSDGVFPLDGALMVVLNVERLLAVDAAGAVRNRPVHELA